MSPMKFLSSLDAGPMRDHLLEAIRLERRRSTTSKALTGFVLFSIGAMVGSSAIMAVMKAREASDTSNGYKTNKADKTDKGDKADKLDKGDKADKGDKLDKPSTYAKPMTNDKPETKSFTSDVKPTTTTPGATSVDRTRNGIA